MATTDEIFVKVDGSLKAHVQRQVSSDGKFATASDYVRELIRRDLEDQIELRDWFDKNLKPALAADESDFIEVSAEDVIRRNKRH